MNNVEYHKFTNFLGEAERYISLDIDSLDVCKELLSTLKALVRCEICKNKCDYEAIIKLSKTVIMFERAIEEYEKDVEECILEAVKGGADNDN